MKRTKAVFMLLATALLALNLTPNVVSQPQVTVDNYTSAASNGVGASASNTLKHDSNVLVVVFVASRDCCRAMQVASVTVGTAIASLVQGSLVRIRDGCKGAEMCQSSAYYAYIKNGGADLVSVNWVDANLETMAFIAVSFNNADPLYPIEAVNSNLSRTSTFVSVQVPAGSRTRLIVQFASFDHDLVVDGFGGSANIIPGARQTLVTTLLAPNSSTLVVAAGPISVGEAVTVTLAHTMIAPVFWETIAFGIKAVS